VAYFGLQTHDGVRGPFDRNKQFLVFADRIPANPRDVQGDKASIIATY